MSTWDLIIVGAGAVGSAALRAASEVGARVLCIEQFTPANARASSHGHSRIFRHAYFEHPDYVPLLRHSTARLESLEAEAGIALLRRCGMLVAGRTDSVIVRGSIASARRWGLAVADLDAAALRARFPWFAFGEDACGALEANAGVVRPEATVHASVAVARTRGAELRQALRVRAVVEDAAGVQVQTDGGRERAAAAIVASGAWTSQLLPELAPLLTVTRQVQAWMAPPAVDTTGMPCWLYDRGPGVPAIYGLPADPQAEASADGVPAPARCPKVALHGTPERVDPDAGARPVDADDLRRIREACRSVAPSLDGTPVAAATCLYTLSPDGQFIVGTRRDSRRVHFAAGLSGHGFKLAPALGDALVDLALRGRTALPVGFLAPTRFAAS